MLAEPAIHSMARREPLAKIDLLPEALRLPSRPSLSDISKITYLKVLTRALLRQIELLEGAKSEVNKDFHLKTQVQEFEAELIRSALQVTRGRQRRAARLLGTKVTTLNTKIRRYKIALNASDQ